MVCTPPASPVYDRSHLDRESKTACCVTLSEQIWGDSNAEVAGDLTHGEGEKRQADAPLCPRRASLATALSDIPQAGFPDEYLEKASAVSRSVTALRAIARVLFPGHDPLDVLCLALPPAQDGPLLRSTANLAVHGDPHVQMVCKALLSNSMAREEVESVLERALQVRQADVPPGALVLARPPPPLPQPDVQARTEMGRRRHQTFLGLYESLARGEKIGKRPYTYRGAQEYFGQAALFLKRDLPTLPARARCVVLEGVTIGPIPILVRGGESVAKLFARYRKAHPAGLGEKTFASLLSAMTTKSKSVTGLSSFYVEVLNLADTVDDMIVHAGKVEKEAEEEGRRGAAGGARGDADAPPPPSPATQRAADHIKALEEYVNFLRHDYGHKHLQISGCGGVLHHCPLHALGSKCPVVHDQHCPECETMHAILPAIYAYLKPTQAPALPEMEKMFRRYQAHKLRETWQRDHLDIIQERLPDQPDHLLLILDHKQKILPAYNRESQASYFGKVGRVGWGEGGAGMRCGRAVRARCLGLHSSSTPPPTSSPSTPFISPREQGCRCSGAWRLPAGPGRKASRASPAPSTTSSATGTRARTCSRSSICSAASCRRSGTATRTCARSPCRPTTPAASPRGSTSPSSTR
jgi:hypothetical protein